MNASAFSDVFAHVEFGFNRLRSVIHESRRRATAISLVDKEVDAACQHLRSLLTRRNALAPISVLPPEILTRIFHFLALDEPPSFINPNLGWIKATHVCRLWRQVALGDSTLWARISGIPLNTKLIFEMLARARNAQLDIDIDLQVGGNPAPELLHVLPLHLSHTRELRLHNLSELHSDGILRIYRQEAPTLEHFELEVSVTSLITFRELSGTTLFKGRAPNLRTLNLFQVLVPWSLIPRGQLTRLTVGLLNEASIASIASRSNSIQLIDLLVNSPGLEVLVLESCLPHQLSLFTSGQTIQLPHLTRLSLGGSASRVTNLLRMLRLSSLAALHLHCISESTPTYTEHLIIPAILTLLRSPDPIEFKTLRVIFDYRSRSLHVAASTSLPTLRFRTSQDFEGHIGDNEFVLSFDGLHKHSDWRDLIERVCNMLPISNLEFLSISAAEDVDPVNLVELFKRCAKVTAMQAIGRGTSGLVQALAPSRVTNTNTRPAGEGKKNRRDSRDGTTLQGAGSAAAHAPAPIFPKLTFLSLRRLGFANIHRSVPADFVFKVFERALQQRMVTCEAPLKMLCIDDCAINAKRANALQKLVQEFHWDKEERHPFDDYYDTEYSGSGSDF